MSDEHLKAKEDWMLAFVDTVLPAQIVVRWFDWHGRENFLALPMSGVGIQWRRVPQFPRLRPLGKGDQVELRIYRPPTREEAYPC